MTLFAGICLVLILLKCGFELWLEKLNQRHVQQHSNTIPEAFKETIDEATYTRSVQYTLARSRIANLETCYDTLVLIALLFSGGLPWFYAGFANSFGESVWSLAGFMVTLLIVLSLAGLPFGWYRQFHLEERFEFNTMSPKLWWIDRFKGLVLSLVIGFPLLLLILKIIDWTGDIWWLWAWGTVLAFQLLMWVIAPLWIMPLFNKFTPLSDGPLKKSLLALADQTAFPARSIQVMDGSKRSRHSNAFFTGFGRFRKIVLYDTLIQQLSIPELKSVLAHEIGHYKLRHQHKLILVSAIASLTGFYVLGQLADQSWFYEAFGFPAGNLGIGLLLFILLSGLATFWLSPLANIWSRRYEYQADAFARLTMKAAGPLINALRKLATKNLSNLTPHPIYSGFYYSHPTLVEREQALRNRGDIE